MNETPCEAGEFQDDSLAVARPRDISNQRPLSAWGERVDALRRTQGMTWRELWRKMGIERSLGRKYLTGDATPSESRVREFADALDVAPAVLEINRPPRQGSARAELEQIRQELDDLRHLVRALREVSEATQADLRELVDSLRQPRPSG